MAVKDNDNVVLEWIQERITCCIPEEARSPHTPPSTVNFSFGIRSLRSRECGLYYEASDLLLGDHLCEKSMTVKWVNVSRPQNRKRRLRDHSN
jgi:hypothetical protein